MMYQHPCTVDVASSQQIEKFVADKTKKQQQAERRLRRQAGARNAAANRYTPKNVVADDAASTTSSAASCCSSSVPQTPINFDRNTIFGTQQAQPLAAPALHQDGQE